MSLFFGAGQDPERIAREVAVPDRKRPWAKPAIRTLRVVGTRTGTDTDIDEDNTDILPVKSSTKRRRIVRRPASGSLMPIPGRGAAMNADLVDLARVRSDR